MEPDCYFRALAFTSYMPLDKDFNFAYVSQFLHLQYPLIYYSIHVCTYIYMYIYAYTHLKQREGYILNSEDK